MIDYNHFQPTFHFSGGKSKPRSGQSLKAIQKDASRYIPKRKAKRAGMELLASQNRFEEQRKKEERRNESKFKQLVIPTSNSHKTEAERHKNRHFNSHNTTTAAHFSCVLQLLNEVLEVVLAAQRVHLGADLVDKLVPREDWKPTVNRPVLDLRAYHVQESVGIW